MKINDYLDQNKKIKNVLEACTLIDDLDVVKDKRVNRLTKKITESINNFFLETSIKTKCTCDKNRFYFDTKLSDNYSMVILLEHLVDYIKSTFDDSGFDYDVFLDLTFNCPSIGFEDMESDFD